MLCCVIVDVSRPAQLTNVQMPFYEQTGGLENQLCFASADCQQHPANDRRLSVFLPLGVSFIFLADLQELHMVADEHRGLALEMTLTKLVQAKNIQIIGMSATMGGESLNAILFLPTQGAWIIELTLPVPRPL